MVFLAILNWMLSHTPGFIRPAVSWLLEGLRRITGWISSRWNWLGVSVSRFLAGVIAFRTALWDFVGQTWTRIVWLVRVVIPRAVAVALSAVWRWVLYARQLAADALSAGLATLRRWAQSGLNYLGGLLSAVRTWAGRQFDKLTATTAELIKRLFPVLNGPAVLAEWLIAALVRVAYRYAYASRDRIAQWLLAGSPSFTRWLAAAMEQIILRWL